MTLQTKHVKNDCKRWQKRGRNNEKNKKKVTVSCLVFVKVLQKTTRDKQRKANTVIKKKKERKREKIKEKKIMRNITKKIKETLQKENLKK